MNCELKELLKNYRSIVVGFSGGADSTALTLMLSEAGIDFSAVHFNHHLRGKESNGDEDFCRQFCKKRNIPLDIVDLNVRKEAAKGESPEAAARNLRMTYWEKHYSRKGCAVLLGHHKDDVLENFLIRSLRGSSSSGLSGLRKIRVIKNVHYLRPLLGETRREITEWLKSKKASWREDSSNSENVYTRNIIRNRIIPELTKTAPVQGLYRTVENVQADADFIEDCALTWLKQNEFNSKNFLNAHEALQPRLLRLFVEKETGQHFIPGHDALTRLKNELNQKHTDTVKIPLGGGVNFILSQHGEIFPEKEKFELYWNWQEDSEITLPDGAKLTTLKKQGCSENFDADSLSAKLLIRNWQPGDRMVPFSKKTPVKVKDLFSDRKTPQSKRQSLPLIFSGDRLIWIPGVRRAEFGRVSENKKTVTLTYEEL